MDEDDHTLSPPPAILDSDASDDYDSSGGSAGEEEDRTAFARLRQQSMATAIASANRYGGVPADEPTTPTWLEVREERKGRGR